MPGLRKLFLQKLKPGISIYPLLEVPVALNVLRTDTNSKQGKPRRKIAIVAVVCGIWSASHSSGTQAAKPSHA